MTALALYPSNGTAKEQTDSPAIDRAGGLQRAHETAGNARKPAIETTKSISMEVVPKALHNKMDNPVILKSVQNYL